MSREDDLGPVLVYYAPCGTVPPLYVMVPVHYALTGDVDCLPLPLGLVLNLGNGASIKVKKEGHLYVKKQSFFESGCCVSQRAAPLLL